MRNIKYSSNAIQNLQEIHDFISLDSVFYAEKVATSIVWYIWWILAVFPEIWKKITTTWVRESIEPSFKYSIFYEIKEDKIKILQISKWKNIQN